jgi:hypothetical protein
MPLIASERLGMLDAAGLWFAGWKGHACELADPEGKAQGELQRFGEHYSLSFDGLTEAQVSRILQVLRTGY